MIGRVRVGDLVERREDSARRRAWRGRRRQLSQGSGVERDFGNDPRGRRRHGDRQRRRGELGESLCSLRRGGRLITCGATKGSNPPWEIQRLFIRQLGIYGSTGSTGRFRELLDVFGRGLLAPVIDRRSRCGTSDCVRSALGRRPVRQDFVGCLNRSTPLAPPSGGEREGSAEIAGVSGSTDRGVVRDGGTSSAVRPSASGATA